MDPRQAKELITPEGKLKLKDETTRSMREVAALVEQARNSINIIDRTEAMLGDKANKNLGNEIPDERHHLRRLAEYTLLVGLIHLDINSAFRAYLNGIEPYDVIYATKHLLVTINEGYKQIYNYLSSEKGREQDAKRNQSYWVKDMGQLINLEVPLLLPEYQKITEALNEYDDDELKEMTKPRNLAIHYDIKASKVYDMLIGLDIEKLATKTLPFLKILNDMIAFSLNALQNYSTIIQTRTDDTVEFHVNKLEEMKSKNPEAEALFSQMQEMIKNFGKTL